MAATVQGLYCGICTERPVAHARSTAIGLSWPDFIAFYVCYCKYTSCNALEVLEHFNRRHISRSFHYEKKNELLAPSQYNSHDMRKLQTRRKTWSSYGLIIMQRFLGENLPQILNVVSVLTVGNNGNLFNLNRNAHVSVSQKSTVY